MNFHSFMKKKQASQATLNEIRDFMRHLTANKHFLGKDEWMYLRTIRAKKKSISWIREYLELATKTEVQNMILDYLNQRPRIEVEKIIYAKRLAEIIQPQVPKFLLPLLVERILEVSKPFHTRPQSDENYIAVIQAELTEVHSLMNLLAVSERVFTDAEKKLAERFDDMGSHVKKGRGGDSVSSPPPAT